MALCTVSAESELLDKVSSWVGGFSVNEFHPSSTSSHKSNEFINEMHLPPKVKCVSYYSTYHSSKVKATTSKFAHKYFML